MLNLKHLYYFYIFSQELSTTRAAERLRISSPALSNQLKQLDEFLGFPLTEKRYGRVAISARGQTVLLYAEKMFSTYEELTSKLALVARNLTDRFHVGISRNVGTRFSLDLLTLSYGSEFKESKNICINYDYAENLLSEFKQDRYDLILGAFQEGPLDGWASHQFHFPVHCFAHKNIADQLGTSPTELKKMNGRQIIEQANKKNIALVVPAPQTVLRAETDQFFAAMKALPIRLIACNSASGILQLIENGLAIGFAPSPSLLDFRSAQDLISLGQSTNFWTHGISVYSQKALENLRGKPLGLAEVFA